MIVTKFDQNPIKCVEEETDCQKEERRRKKKLESAPFSRALVKLGGRVSNYQVAQPLSYISEPLTVAQMRILFMYAQSQYHNVTYVWGAPANMVSQPATGLARLNVVSHPATNHAQLNVL